MNTNRPTNLSIAALLFVLALSVNTLKAQITFTLTDTIYDQTGMSNYDAGSNAHPALWDYDGDGDLDMLIGASAVGGDGNILRFLENTGTATTPQWTAKISTQNPMNGLGTNTSNVTPTFVDIDNNGALDLFIGDDFFNIFILPYRQVFHYEYNSTDSSFTLVENEFLSLGLNDMALDFVDLDTDGDYDLFVGRNNSGGADIEYWQNNGTPTSPTISFVGLGEHINVTDGSNPLWPRFYDIDFDGDQDAFLGRANGTIWFYENEGSPSVPKFVLNATDNPFAGIDVGDRASVLFADIIGNDGIVEALIGNNAGYVQYYSSNQGGYEEVASRSYKVSASDVANNGNGLDLTVAFDTAAAESTVASYRIMVVKASKSDTFELSEANAVGASDYTTVAKGTDVSGVYTVNLGAGATDVDGDALEEGVDYTVFVLSIATGTATANGLSAGFDITLGSPTVAVTSLAVADVADKNNGKDLGIQFTKASPEGNVKEYRALVVKTSEVGTFNLSAAYSASNYLLLPTGSNVDTTFGATDSIVDGDLIVIDSSYTVFVLTVGYGDTANSTLSAGVTITLTTSPAGAVSNLTVVDNGNANNASDFYVTFDKPADESLVDSFKVIIVKLDSVATFNISKASALTKARYVPVAKTGSNLSKQLTNIKDSDGDAVVRDSLYQLFVLSKGLHKTANNTLSSPSDTTWLSRIDTVVVTSIKDIDNNGNGSDIKVSFTPIEDESLINEYRLYVFKSSDNDTTFTTAWANSASALSRYNSISTGVTTVLLDSTLQDVNGVTLTENEPYNLYITTDTGFGGAWTISTMSDTFEIYPAVTAPAWEGIVATDIDNNNSGEDLKVSFITPASEGGILEYRAYAVVEEEAPDFALSDAEALTSIAYASVAPDGSDTLEVIFNFSSTDQTETDNLQEGVQYRIFVASIADTTKVSDPNAMEAYQAGYDGNLIELDPITGGDGVVDYALSKALRVYPSPAQTTITVSLEGQAGSMDIAIYNMKGEQLLNAAASQSRSIINVTSLTSGNYILKVSNGDKVAAKLFVKE